jgi:hypothetical protein
MPALPLDEAGKYVAAAYLIFLLLVLIYVAIMAAKIARIEREVSELVELTEPDSGRGAIDLGGLEAPRVQERPDADQPSQDAGLEAPRR